jgi:uncharacterized repeat protein (TIGR03803 family)
MKLRAGYFVSLFCVAAAITASAQVLTTLHSFCAQQFCFDGAAPFGGLVQGADGNFYGTTATGGDSREGTVFRISSGGTLTTLHSFDSFDGEMPRGGLLQGIDGNFYGTTWWGGGGPYCTNRGGCGTLFKITPQGTLTTLYNFCSQPGCSDGLLPGNGLVQDSAGNLYGTTIGGGSHGTIFKITPSGTLTTMRDFQGNDGWYPFGALMLARDGNFYGTTMFGGTGSGVIFQMTSNGTLTVMHSFSGGVDGGNPYAGLVQGSDGNFYGTTVEGGAYGQGTVFQMTAAGTMATLYSFCARTNCTDGAAPRAGLIQANDGNLYGATSAGGTGTGCNGGCGTVFKITTTGALITLHDFHGTDGEAPWGALVQGIDGTLYGTTTSLGANGNGGTIFRSLVRPTPGQ